MVVFHFLNSGCQIFLFSIKCGISEFLMKSCFEYLPYRRKFVRPLATAHGTWETREGIIIRLSQDDGWVGFGEIAPIPWFGSETFDEALEWCKNQAKSGSVDRAIPESYLCCQWAVAAANADWMNEGTVKTFKIAALLDSFGALEEKQQAGFETFKLKIGASNFSEESEQLDRIFDQLNPGQLLRLDANGGLSEGDFIRWLDLLEGKPVDFLEQPLAAGLENRMLEMIEPYSTAVALDESVVGLRSLRSWRHWPGPLIVKPGLLGNWTSDLGDQIIGSSILETSFGLEASLRFLERNQKLDTAIGFDTASLLENDGWNIHNTGKAIASGRLFLERLQALWEEKVGG
tara:strand:+ start:7251 stop:8288 length:1038 start_codon:yes stop_codon:yes gene_type:complete